MFGSRFAHTLFDLLQDLPRKGETSKNAATVSKYTEASDFVSLIRQTARHDKFGKRVLALLSHLPVLADTCNEAVHPDAEEYLPGAHSYHHDKTDWFSVAAFVSQSGKLTMDALDALVDSQQSKYQLIPTWLLSVSDPSRRDSTVSMPCAPTVCWISSFPSLETGRVSREGGAVS